MCNEPQFNANNGVLDPPSFLDTFSFLIIVHLSWFRGWPYHPNDSSNVLTLCFSILVAPMFAC
jgi:hypothetical protein